jgi:purine-binding chemotaxis protein CheW
MAKSTRRFVDRMANDARVDAEKSATEEVAHVVIFHLGGGGRFGFRLDEVGEIVRMPRIARMPLSPRSLLGLANLHGGALPIVDLRRLLGLSEVPLNESARVIVVDRGAPVGFVVDRIDRLFALPTGRIEKDDAGAGEVDPTLVDGIIKGAEGEDTVKILKPGRLLRDEFSRIGVSRKRVPSAATASTLGVESAGTSARKVSLVSFELGGQEYALPLAGVREIVRVPEQIAKVARSESIVLGVVTLRDRLLPLVSLRALLGLPADGKREDPGKVVVLPMGSGAVGVVADRTREILHVDPGDIDPAPSLLTRGEGEAEITSICRLDHGKRLIALLSPDRLFRSDLVRRVLSEQSPGDAGLEMDVAMSEEQFVIFRLADQEYGLPIAAVDEIARPPEQIARLPKAPAFVDGVMNLRGVVMPIVDLRRRFDIASTGPVGSQRILVLALDGGKTGFMVDGVSEVMKIPEGAIRAAPELSTDQMRLVGRVANLDAQDRMILLVDPAQLLDRIEADVLAKFDRSVSERESSAS